MLTRADVEAEHLAALARLTVEQRAALHRTREALRIGNFNHHSLREVLPQLLEREARARSPEVSAEAVEREHVAAFAGLDRLRREALRRLDRALQIGNFSHHAIKEILDGLFKEEAARRNDAAAWMTMPSRKRRKADQKMRPTSGRISWMRVSS